MTRSDAAVFAAWLVAFSGDPDYFLKILIEVWGSRYGAAQIPGWLEELAGPWEPGPEEAAAAAAAEPDPRRNAGEARARRAQGPSEPPRPVAQKSLYVPRASGQDSGPATRAPRPQPSDGAPPMVSPEATPAAAAAHPGAAEGVAAPRGKGRITIGGKPASREDIARTAEEARRALTGEGMRPAPRPVDEGGGGNGEALEEGGEVPAENDLADASDLLAGLTGETGEETPV
jgi:hypothetical protein